MSAVVRFDGVSTRYGMTLALEEVSFTVERGEYVVIAGANGSGKSTLLRAMLGSLPYTGEISLFDKPLKQFKDWSKIGYMPQKMYSYNPIFPASVEEVVSLGLLAGKQFVKRITLKDRQAVEHVLSELDILDLRHHQIQALSGGQQQRVFIARALVAAPELLVMDEPTSSLDIVSRQKLFELLRNLNREHAVTVLLISHDVSDLCSDASRLIYLDNKVVFDGSMDGFCDAPASGHRDVSAYAQHLFHHHHRDGARR